MNDTENAAQLIRATTPADLRDERQPPGHALDCTVAGNFIRATLFTQEGMRAEAERVWKEQPLCCHFMMGFEFTNGRFEQKIPRYSTDPQASNVLKNMIARHGWRLRINHYPEGAGTLYSVQALKDGPTMMISVASGTSEMHAIALLAAAIAEHEV